MVENLRNDSVTVGTSAVTVSLEQNNPNAQRSMIVLTNISTGGQTIYLAFGAEAKASQGIALAVGGYHAEALDAGFKPTNQQITAIASAAGGTLAVHERIINTGYAV